MGEFYLPPMGPGELFPLPPVVMLRYASWLLAVVVHLMDKRQFGVDPLVCQHGRERNVPKRSHCSIRFSGKPSKS